MSAQAAWTPAYGVAPATQSTPSARPSVVLDPISGKKCVRIDTGQSLVIPTGVLDFLHQGPATLIIGWRGRKWTGVNATMNLLDSSGNGATRGYQCRVQDNPGTSLYRWVNGRISNGSSFIISHDNATHGPSNNYAPLLTNITTMQTSATRARLQVDRVVAYDDALTGVTLPTGAGGPTVIGGGAQVDIFFIFAFAGGITDTQLDAWNDYLEEEYNIPLVQCLAGDAVVNPDPRPPGLNYFGFPSMCIMPNGSYLVTLSPSAFEGGNSSLAIITSSSGKRGSWSAVRTLIPYDGTNAIHDIVPTTMLNGDIVILFMIGVTQQFFIRSSDNAKTWSAPVRITRGYAQLEFASAKIFEEGDGEWRVQMYTQGVSDLHWDTRIFESHDHGATFPSDTRVANGNADLVDYAEQGEVTLGGSNRLAVVRDTTNHQMVEYLSANAGVSWGGQAFAFSGEAAARMVRTVAGDVVMLVRPAAFLASTLTLRLGPGSWSALPDAPGICCAPSANEYGEIVEKTPGMLDVVFGAFYGAYAANAYFRRWPVWQLKGKFPIEVSPAAPGALQASSVVTFTATSIGNITWSLPSGGGSVGASTGVLTVGTANGAYFLRATDLNDNLVDVPFTVVGGSSILLPTQINLAHLTLWLDPTTLGTIGSGFLTWTSSDAGAHVWSRGGLPLVAAGPTGRKVVAFNGSTDSMNDLVSTLATYVTSGVGWTIGWVSRDDGSPADSGMYFFNAQIFSDTNGFFGLGTTSSTVFAGQDGGGVRYDSHAQAGGAWHSYIVKYDPGVGKVFISVDGVFDGGMVVNAIGNLTGNLSFAKSTLNGALYKGAVGDFVIYNALLSDPDIAAFQAFLNSTLT